jgi:hypothetical protein
LKKNRKTVLEIVAAAAFAVFMMLNITPKEDGLAVTLCGEAALASDLPCQ